MRIAILAAALAALAPLSGLTAQVPAATDEPTYTVTVEIGNV